MLDEGNNFNLETPTPPPAEEAPNRTFLIVGGIMAGLVFLTLVCMAGYFLLIGPRLSAQRAATQTAVFAMNAQVAQQMTATAQAKKWTPTSLPSPLPTATNTPLPVTPTSSPTPVVAQPSDTPFATTDPLTATMAALQTQVAANQLTLTVQAQATGMPKTGFADEVGLPGLVIMALALVAVILLARRLRRAPAK